MTEYIFAIDPGDVMSAYCVVDAKTYKPLEIGKVANNDLRGILLVKLREWASAEPRKYTVVIERIASYGMAVGATVFVTCEWVGRFAEISSGYGAGAQYIYRKEEKMLICGDMRAKDANIRRALIDRFAQHDQKTGRGTKANPDWFHGFHDDIWSAYAVAVSYLDKLKHEERSENYAENERLDG